MNRSNPEDPETLKLKLNRDTAKIKWKSLDQFYQQGVVINVASKLDLITVACEFSNDNRVQVQTWLQQSLIAKVSDTQAQFWNEKDREIWAVVVAPWVLVQDQKPESQR